MYWLLIPYIIGGFGTIALSCHYRGMKWRDYSLTLTVLTVATWPVLIIPMLIEGRKRGEER